MNKEDLRQLLKSKNVPHQSYSLDGLKDGECLCIINENNSWRIIYNSRGRITQTIECKSEDDACDKLYQMISDAYNW